MALVESERLSLKRIKICGVSKKPMANLLKNLSALTSIVHMEIDELVVDANDTPLELTFKTLQVFSVDSVKVADRMEVGSASAGAKHLILHAPQLKTLYLRE